MKKSDFLDLEMTDLSLSQMRFLVALFESNNLSVAAAKQSMSLGAASRLLASLRKAADDPLFTRTGHGLLPTRKCCVLMKRLPDLIVEFEDLFKQDSLDVTQVDRTIRISVSDQGFFLMLQQAITVLMQKAPHLTFEIVPRTSSTFNDLRVGDIDYAVFPLFSLPGDFHFCNLYEAQTTYLMRPEHPLIEYRRIHGEVPAEEIAKYKKIQMATTPIQDVHRVIDANAQVPQEVAIWTPYMVASLPLLKQTDLTMNVPSRLALKMAKPLGLAVLPKVISSKGFMRRLIWHDQTHRDPLMQWVRSILISEAIPSAQEKKELDALSCRTMQ